MTPLEKEPPKLLSSLSRLYYTAFSSHSIAAFGAFDLFSGELQALFAAGCHFGHESAADSAAVGFGSGLGSLMTSTFPSLVALQSMQVKIITPLVSLAGCLMILPPSDLWFLFSICALSRAQTLSCCLSLSLVPCFEVADCLQLPGDDQFLAYCFI